MRRSTRRSISVAAPSEDEVRSIDLKKEDEVRSSVSSFSTKFSLPSFVKRVEKLTDDQKSAIKRTGFGNLLLFPNHMVSKNFLAELMDKWNVDKLSFEIGSRTVPITLMDVALILGLPVAGDPVILKEDEEFSDLEAEFGAVMPKRQITISSIKTRLDSLGDTCNDDFVRTFLLFTMGTLLFPNSVDKVDSRLLSSLQNLDDVCHLAWGAAVLEEMQTWLTKRKEISFKYMGGCLIFLQIWSYEHIDVARPNLLDAGLTFPRVCRWENSKANKPQWFADKFKELQDDQVICELEPTSAEKSLSIVRELLRSQTNENQLELDEQFLVVNDTDDETDLDADTREAVATENSSLLASQTSASGYESEDHQKLTALTSSGEAHVNSPNVNVAFLSDTTVASSREELETVDVDTPPKVAAVEIVPDTPVASSGEELERVDLDSRSDQVSHFEQMEGKEEEWTKEKQLLEEENQKLKEEIAGLMDKLKIAEEETEFCRLKLYEFESHMESIRHDYSSNADETRDLTQIDQ